MKTRLWISTLLTALALMVQGVAQNPNGGGTGAGNGAATPGAADSTPAPAPGGDTPPSSSALKDVRKLMPNDILSVRVVGELDLTVERRVANDGTITYPFLDSIKVDGKTPSEVEAIIREGLAKDYLVNPQVMVDVKDYVKQFFTVDGQVNRVGQYEYPVDRKLDVLEAISMAGGFSKLAQKGKIEVRRGNETFKFSEKQLKDSNDPSKKFFVQPNDKVIVDERVF